MQVHYISPSEWLPIKDCLETKHHQETLPAWVRPNNLTQFRGHLQRSVLDLRNSQVYWIDRLLIGTFGNLHHHINLRWPQPSNRKHQQDRVHGFGCITRCRQGINLYRQRQRLNHHLHLGLLHKPRFSHYSLPTHRKTAQVNTNRLRMGLQLKPPTQHRYPKIHWR